VAKKKENLCSTKKQAEVQSNFRNLKTLQAGRNRNGKMTRIRNIKLSGKADFKTK